MPDRTPEELEALRNELQARYAERRRAQPAAQGSEQAREPSMADLLKPPSVAAAKNTRPKKLPRGRNPWMERRIRVHAIGHDIAHARQRARIAEKSPPLSDVKIKNIIDEARTKERENGR